ncbi:MAG: HEPN domain-containing protein [Dehalococcoidia bacterium]|nr:HEPN domain-containing protein [Dehalococcoidia bacterium]
MLPQEYSARIEKANAFLNTAQLAMRNGDYESCVSRSYYAAYHMVVILLASKANIRRKRWDHNELHRAFGEQFCKKGWLYLPERTAIYLERFNLSDSARIMR